MKRAGCILGALIITGICAPAHAQSGDRDTDIIYMPKPEFPFLASLLGLTGYCEAHLSVDETGQPFSVQISCSAPAFCESARDMAMGMRFRPAMKDGVPVRRTNIVQPIGYYFLEEQIPKTEPEVHLCEAPAIS